MAFFNPNRIVLSLLGKVPLRTLLIVPFVLQIGLAVSLTAWFSIRNGEKAVNDLSTRLRSEISQRTMQKLDTYLAIPHQINQLNRRMIDLGSLNLKDTQALGRYFWQQMQVFNVGYINFGGRNGEFIGAGIVDGKIRIEEELPGQPFRTFATDRNGNRTSVVLTKLGVNSTNSAWYLDAAQTGKVVWSSIYNWADSPDVLSISSSYPIYDRDRRFLGVIGVDLILSEISSFLHGLKVGRTGQVFIVERNGLLVATSTSDAPYVFINGVAERIKATNVRNPLTQATARFIATQKDKLQNIKTSQQIEFRIADKRQFVQVTPWQDPFGLDWLILVVVPEADFMETINANTHTTLLLCMLASLVAVLLGLVTSRWIAKPIARLSQASQAIACGELNHSVEEATLVKELGILARAFNQMAQQLRGSFDRVQVALQDSEERFTKAFRCSPDAMTIATLAEGRHLEVNDSFCRLIDMPREAVIGKTANDLKLWANPRDCSPLNWLLKTTASTSNREVEFCLPSGDVRTVLLSAEVVNLEGQDCILAVFKDISDRKQAEQEILKALAREKELGELKSRFVTMVSHEFRTPLTTIQAATELLEYYNWSTEEREERFHQIKSAVRHMTSLLEDVLVVGQAESGKLKINCEAVDLLQLCHEAIGEIRLSTNGQHTLELNQQGILQPLQLDRKLIRQILNNLLSNALKYSPAGGKIALTLTYLANCVQIQIQDEGIGIPEEDRENLFCAFHRATNVSNIQGTGLGLVIVKKFVELHKGQIDLQSKVGKGTMVTVTFPLVGG